MILQKLLRTKYCLTIGPINVKESDHVKLLGITIDKNLNFKKHIDNICCNANYKLYVFKKVKLLDNAFIDSQFNSALLMMFSLKTLYLKIEKIHHKTFRIIHQSNATYRDLQECKGSTSFHQQHLQFSLTEIYKSILATSTIFIEIICKRVQCFFFQLQGQELAGKSLHIFVAH